MFILMDKNYTKFVRKIYSSCDNNIGKKVLFPFFMNCWPEELTLEKKDLAIHTSKIVSRLISNKILKEVPKEKDFYNVYGMYEILKHEKLIQ